MSRLTEIRERAKSRCDCHYSSGDGALDNQCVPCAMANSDRSYLLGLVQKMDSVNKVALDYVTTKLSYSPSWGKKVPEFVALVDALARLREEK